LAALQSKYFNLNTVQKGEILYDSEKPTYVHKRKSLMNYLKCTYFAILSWISGGINIFEVEQSVSN
jgi:hypothetical protein